MKLYSITGERKKELMKIAQKLGVTITEIQEPTPDLSDIVIATYENSQKLLIKSNDTFKGTPAEITIASGEVKRGHEVFRSALRTTAYESQLPYLPITPLQSEQLLKDGKLPKPPTTYWEDLALVLYDLSSNGANPEHAKSLFKKLKSDLHKTKKDLPLLVVNTGLKPNSRMPHNIEFTVLPITRAYSHLTLKQTGKHNFEYGLRYGLPSINDLGKGNRILYMPSQNNNLGLRILYRNRVRDLDAGFEDLVNSSEVGRATLTR